MTEDDPNSDDTEARQAAKAKRLIEERREDLRALMAVPAARRLFWRVLEQAGVYRESMVAGAPDVTAYHEGRRSIGLALIGDLIDASPESYMALQVEHLLKSRNDNG